MNTQPNITDHLRDPVLREYLTTQAALKNKTVDELIERVLMRCMKLQLIEKIDQQVVGEEWGVYAD